MTILNLSKTQDGGYNYGKQKNGAQFGMVAKEAYEAKVELEALARAGSCPQLKGHVHRNFENAG